MKNSTWNNINEKNLEIIKEFLRTNILPHVEPGQNGKNVTVEVQEMFRKIMEKLLIPAQDLNKIKPPSTSPSVTDKTSVNEQLSTVTNLSTTELLQSTETHATSSSKPIQKSTTVMPPVRPRVVRPRLKVNKSNLKGDVAPIKVDTPKKSFRSSSYKAPSLSPEKVLRKLAGGEVHLTAEEKKAFIKSILNEGITTSTVSTTTSKIEQETTSADDNSLINSEFLVEKILEKENPFEAFNSVIEIQEPEFLPENPVKTFEDTVLKNPRFREARKETGKPTKPENSPKTNPKSVKIINLFKELSDEDIEILNKFLDSVVKYRRTMTKRNIDGSEANGMEIEDLFKELIKSKTFTATTEKFEDKFFDDSETVESVEMKSTTEHESTTMVLGDQLNSLQTLTSTTERDPTLDWKTPVELDFVGSFEDVSSAWKKPEEMDVDGTLEDDASLWDKPVEINVDGKLEDFDGLLEEYKETTVGTNSDEYHSTTPFTTTMAQVSTQVTTKPNSPRRVAKHIINGPSFPTEVVSSEPLVNQDLLASILSTKPLSLNFNQPQDLIKKPTWIQKIESETSAERHERVKNDLQKLMQFVSLMSHVDTYLVGRAKNAVKKFAMILDTDEDVNEYYDKRKRRHH